MPDAWIREINGWIYPLLGHRAVLENSGWVPIAVLVGVAVVALAAGLGCWWFLRGVLRRLDSARFQISLLSTGPGWQAAAMARRIRRSARSFIHLLQRSQIPSGEREALAVMVREFLRDDLPDALQQLAVFSETAQPRSAAALDRQLTAQTRRWGELPEGSGREALTQEIAKTRQRLAQLAAPIEAARRLLEGLRDTSAALDVLAAETASLGVIRSQALDRFRGRVSLVAEGIRHESRAHLDLRRES